MTRRIWAWGWLGLSAAACAGLLGIDDVTYSPAVLSDASEGAAADGPSDAASDAPCSVDVLGDPEHCGTCGHRCGAGIACHAGLCDPELVISGLREPASVLLRIAGATYASTGYGVYRCATTGCTDAGDPLLEAGKDEIVTGFSADDAGMAVGILTVTGLGIPGGRVVVCPTLGVCAAPRVLVPSEQNLQTVARTDTDVLWGRDGNFNFSDLVSCPLAGCDGGATVLGAFDTSLANRSTTDIAADGPSIVWMVGNRLLESRRDGGTTPAILAFVGGTSFDAQHLTRSGGLLYWGNIEARAVERCDLGNCATTRTVLAVVGGKTRRLAVDGPFLYMTVDAIPIDGGTAGFVGRTPTSGLSTIEVLARPKVVGALAVDSTHVYWGDGDGNVWRVAK